MVTSVEAVQYSEIVSLVAALTKDYLRIGLFVPKPTRGAGGLR